VCEDLCFVHVYDEVGVDELCVGFGCCIVGDLFEWMMLVTCGGCFMLSEIFIISLENFSCEDCWFLLSEEFSVWVVVMFDFYDCVVMIFVVVVGFMIIVSVLFVYDVYMNVVKDG